MTALQKIGTGVFVIALLIVISWVLSSVGNGIPEEETMPTEKDTTPTREEQEVVVVIAEHLEIPWDIAFLSDGSMLVTERPGRLLHVESGRAFEVSGVEHVGEGGLLGIVLHPDFEENSFVYLYQTTRTQGGLENRVVRYVYHNNELIFDREVLSGIPGARFHDGGQIAFGPDGYLYVTTGDAGNENAAQDTNSLAGKILRIAGDGSIPENNPFGNAVWSYGHRNPQGLSWDATGQLWSTEHGRSGVLSGFDELNRIDKGKNYGWPDSQGDNAAAGTVAPTLHSTASVTWAPASLAFHNGFLYWGGLRGETLYRYDIAAQKPTKHFENQFGRIRAVVVGPDEMLYITTSNRDGRGDPQTADDKVIRIDPSQL